MAKISLCLGGLLVLLGLGVFGGFRLGQGEWPSPTALLPSFLGIPIVLLGWLALRPACRRHAMHLVSLLALLGVVLPLLRLLMVLFSGGELGAMTLISLGLTVLLSALLLGGCVKSFVEARRARAAAAAEESAG